MIKGESFDLISGNYKIMVVYNPFVGGYAVSLFRLDEIIKVKTAFSETGLKRIINKWKKISKEKWKKVKLAEMR